jgi:hypothetical protein
LGHAATNLDLNRERSLDSSEAMIHIAMLDNVSRRIADESTPARRGKY